MSNFMEFSKWDIYLCVCVKIAHHQSLNNLKALGLLNDDVHHPTWLILQHDPTLISHYDTFSTGFQRCWPTSDQSRRTGRTSWTHERANSDSPSRCTTRTTTSSSPKRNFSASSRWWSETTLGERESRWEICRRRHLWPLWPHFQIIQRGAADQHCGEDHRGSGQGRRPDDFIPRVLQRPGTDWCGAEDVHPLLELGRHGRWNPR